MPIPSHIALRSVLFADTSSGPIQRFRGQSPQNGGKFRDFRAVIAIQGSDDRSGTPGAICLPTVGKGNYVNDQQN